MLQFYTKNNTIYVNCFHVANVDSPNSHYRVSSFSVEIEDVKSSRLNTPVMWLTVTGMSPSFWRLYAMGGSLSLNIADVTRVQNGYFPSNCEREDT